MAREGLERIAALIRSDILKMTTAAGSGHPGGSMSAADIMAALFFGGILRYDPLHPAWPGRDRFILSKGHVAPVLYATLARAGYFPIEELASLRKHGSRLQGHPDMLKLPGVEVSTGSLGQGLSVAAGLAYALGLTSAEGPDQPRVFTLLGDGECQEGQVWEAAMLAGHKRLSNLIAIIDNNGLQIDGRLEDVCDIGDLAAKFEQFGWLTVTVDGHDIAALLDELSALASSKQPKPRLLVAETVKGKGVSFMEGEAAWHGKSLSEKQLAEALAELAPSIGPLEPGEDWDKDLRGGRL